MDIPTMRKMHNLDDARPLEESDKEAKEFQTLNEEDDGIRVRDGNDDVFMRHYNLLPMASEINNNPLLKHCGDDSQEHFLIMSLSFDGWSAYDIVGPLNKREVRAALLDYEIEKSSFRSWDSVEEMIMRSSVEVKNVLYRSSMAKRKVEEQHRIMELKRKRESMTMMRNVRRRIGEYGCVF
jgi:hypothetical protein